MGKLIFKYGSMNASKSANLIMSCHNYTSNGKSVLTFKPASDTRDYGYVVSRAIETKITAHLIAPDVDGIMYQLAEFFLPRIVLVDEVQFLTAKQIEELAQIVDELGVTVHAYGLMTDFKSNLFEGSKRLVELADIVERIRSECTLCNNEGLMNARFVGEEIQSCGESIAVGDIIDKSGSVIYKVLCRKCYNDLLKDNIKLWR